MIAQNAGAEGSIVLAKMRESKEENFGCNAHTDVYENPVTSGVIDPSKVTRTALLNAASIAWRVLKTECVVVERKEENPVPAGGRSGGGMGGCTMHTRVAHTCIKPGVVTSLTPGLASYQVDPKRLGEGIGDASEVYCEHGAITGQLKEMQRADRIRLLHFPYDPESRPRITSISEPSAAQIRDLHLPIDDLPGRIADYRGSTHFEGVLSILGKQHRRDALHIDSAVKSGAIAFMTQDRDILQHRAVLEALLSIRIFDSERDQSAIEQFVAQAGF